MPGERLSMRKIREVLRLRPGQGLRLLRIDGVLRVDADLMSRHIAHVDDVLFLVLARARRRRERELLPLLC